MLNKENCVKHLEREIIRIITNNETCEKVYDFAKEKYNIPRVMISDLLGMRTSLIETSDFILFCLLDSIEKVTEVKKTSIDQFYTMQEAKTYRTSQYETESVKFPLRFKMIQVAEDQWIGSVTVKEMMKLRAAQLINYNVNAQRTMTRIIRGDKEIFKISLNQATLSAIRNLYKENKYISTPFTLNIEEDSDSDFYYDRDRCELIINKIDHLDISDGYHRYIAACQESDENPDFDYNMELRIINFSTEKAKQFIYQEDQKTKMKKIDSNSMNMNNPANSVVNRLNENSQSNLQGLISRNQGTINFGELSGLVSYFYFKGVTKDKEKTTIIATTKELIEKFNMITEYNSDYLEKHYSYKQLVAIMCLFNTCDNDTVCRIIDEVVNRTQQLDNIKFANKIPKKSMMNDVEEIIKEVA